MTISFLGQGGRRVRSRYQEARTEGSVKARGANNNVHFVLLTSDGALGDSADARRENGGFVVYEQLEVSVPRRRASIGDVKVRGNNYIAELGLRG